MKKDFVEGAEERLRESEVRYRTLFNTIDEGFCIIEFFDGPHGPLSDYVHVEANPAYERHAGIPNVVGQKVREMVPGEADGWVELYRNVLMTGRPIRFERELVATGRFLELSAFRVEPESRRQVAVLFQDITARKKAEAALAESRERWQTVANSAPVLMWHTDASGVNFVNRHYLNFFGVGFEAIAAMGWADFLHPEDYAGYVGAYRGAWERQSAYEYQCRFRRHDGEYRWLHNVGSPHRGADGVFLGFVGCSADVTDIKRAEQLLQSEAKRLDVLVQQRTGKLQAALGELEAFSYSVAHDLRAPLRALSGYAKELLEEEELSKAGRMYAERIDRAATRMDRLTLEVLAYSQLSRTEVDLHSVDLDRLVHELLEQYPDVTAHCKNIVVQSPLLPVLAHEPMLTQALANLLRNACKFVSEGTTPRVVLRTEEMDGEVRIWVEDNGIGISPEHRSRLFKLFGRIHPEQKFGGTGVGLAIVMKAAERMGGSAGFESEVGKGSQFWVQLKKG